MTHPALVWAFPMPDGPLLQHAYRDLYLVENGTDRQKQAIGDPARLPRPWDPPTCTDPLLREEVWEWLEAFVTWFNHEYVWDPNAGMIPTCWPHHPHLIHDIAVLADQRRRAAIATTSDLLEEWHRYTIPAFTDRMRTRLKTQCDDTHSPWPARSRHTRHTDHPDDRGHAYHRDVTNLIRPTSRPTGGLHVPLIDGEERIDPTTGEVL